MSPALQQRLIDLHANIARDFSHDEQLTAGELKVLRYLQMLVTILIRAEKEKSA